MPSETIRIQGLGYWVETTTGRFQDRHPRRQIARIGSATIHIRSKKRSSSGKLYTWELWRRGTHGRADVSISGKFKKTVKWAKKPRKKRLSLGKMTITYDAGHGKRSEIYELMDRGPERVRGKRINRYFLQLRTKSGKKTLSTKTIALQNYRDASQYVKNKVSHLKATVKRKPSYHVLRLHDGDKAVSKHAIGTSLEQGKKVILDEIQTTKNELLRFEKIVKEHKRTRAPTQLTDFKTLPRSYVHTKKKLKVGTEAAQIHSFTKRVETKKGMMVEHLMYKLLRWRIVKKYDTTTLAKWNEVSWLLLRWGQARGYGRTVPTYTVVDPHGKEHDFRVPLTPKEKDKMLLTKSRLRGVTFTRKPLDAAKKFIDTNMETWFSTIQFFQRQREPKLPDYYQKGRKESSERIGSKRVKVIRYGFLKRPIATENMMKIIGGLMVEVYAKGKKKPEKDWHWQLKRESVKKGGLYHVGKTQFFNKRNARNYIIDMAEAKIDSIRFKELG